MYNDYNNSVRTRNMTEVFPDKFHLMIRGPMSVYPWLVPPRGLPYVEHREREEFRACVVTNETDLLEHIYACNEEPFWKRKIALAELLFRGWKPSIETKKELL